MISSEVFRSVTNSNPMPSLVNGFEYDVFISYRQNDNLPGRLSGGSG